MTDLAESEDWLTLGHGETFVALKAAGPVRFDQPAWVWVKAGVVEGKRHVGLWGAGEFIDALRAMHRTLSGSSRLEALEGDFSLSLTMKERGFVEVAATLCEHWGGAFEFDFNCRFEIDQSYLPPFAVGLRREFPLSL